MAIFWDIHQKQDWEFENQLPELAEVSKLDLSWVQCNRCMRKMIKYETLRYGLTNCGHIFCENCLKNATQPKCFVCQSANPRAIVLDPQNLRPELRTQFLAIVPTSQWNYACSDQIPRPSWFCQQSKIQKRPGCSWTSIQVK